MAGKSKPSFITEDHNPVVGIISAYTPETELTEQDYHAEFLNLLESADVEIAATLSVRLRSIDPGFFFTKGKRQEIVQFCQEKELDHIIVSHTLSPIQQRNLENICGCRVFDRTELIISIFRKSAHSAEGQIQTEMAYLSLLKTRIAGRGREMAQQEGFIGTRGPGETGKEKLARYYKEKMRQAEREIVQLAHVRTTQRKQRLKRGTPLVSLVGYTNAGKSSIAHLLTNSDVQGENKLFATLDTTVRQLYINDKQSALLSDTVGFISQLPPQLVNAFRSTLEELQYAQLILHVVDAANTAWREHVLIVNKTLDELEVQAPRSLVFNKIDRLSEEQLATLHAEVASLFGTADIVFVSAFNKNDAGVIKEYVAAHPAIAAILNAPHRTQGWSYTEEDLEENSEE